MENDDGSQNRNQTRGRGDDSLADERNPERAGIGRQPGARGCPCRGTGRTGRAGQGGVAISLVGPGEEAHLAVIEKKVGRRFGRAGVRAE